MISDAALGRKPTGSFRPGRAKSRHSTVDPPTPKPSGIGLLESRRLIRLGNDEVVLGELDANLRVT